MKQTKYLFFAIALALATTFVGSSLNSNGSLSVNAQESMMKSVGDKIADTSKTVANKTVKGTKKTYRVSRRVGTTVGSRTWTGTKWVASKSWKGGKWVAVKTKNGTKWVYRKGRNVVKGATTGAKKPVP